MEDKGVTLLTHQGYGIPSRGDSPKQEYFRGKNTQEEKSIYSNVLSDMCTYLMLVTVFIH